MNRWFRTLYRTFLQRCRSLLKIYSTLKCSERTMGDFQGFLQRKEDLLHSYEKFRFAGGVNKPPFDAVYREVKTYLKDVLPKEVSKEDADGSQQ